MTSTELLELARAISKDSNDEQYSKSLKYSMLSQGQEAALVLVKPEFVPEAVKLYTVATSTATEISVTLPSDWLKFASAYDRDKLTRYAYVDIRNLDAAKNDFVIGGDFSPYCFIRKDTTTEIVFRNKNTIANEIQLFYVYVPETLSDTVNPVSSILAPAIIAYFKFLFHIAEGQTDLSNLAYQTFLKTLEPYMEKVNG